MDILPYTLYSMYIKGYASVQGDNGIKWRKETKDNLRNAREYEYRWY